MSVFRRFRQFRDDRRGVAAIEFGVVMSVVTILLLGGIELSYYLLVRQKLDRAAASMGDLVGQAQTLTQVDLDNIFTAAQHITQPLDFANQGVVIVSMVNSPDGTAKTILWQRRGGGALTATSVTGIESGPATLPTGFTLLQGESTIVAEIHFHYKPILIDLFVGERTVTHRSYYRPRLSSQVTIN